MAYSNWVIKGLHKGVGRVLERNQSGSNHTAVNNIERLTKETEKKKKKEKKRKKANSRELSLPSLKG